MALWLAVYTPPGASENTILGRAVYISGGIPLIYSGGVGEQGHPRQSQGLGRVLPVGEGVLGITGSAGGGGGSVPGDGRSRSLGLGVRG